MIWNTNFPSVHCLNRISSKRTLSFSPLTQWVEIFSWFFFIIRLKCLWKLLKFKILAIFQPIKMNLFGYLLEFSIKTIWLIKDSRKFFKIIIENSLLNLVNKKIFIRKDFNPPIPYLWGRCISIDKTLDWCLHRKS